MKYENWKLERTGDVPLKFAGYVIGADSSYMPYGPNQDIYEEYTLYRTQGGKYVLDIDHKNQWERHSDTEEAFISDDLKGLIEKYREAHSWEDGYLPEELINILEKAGDIAEEVE